MNLFRNEPILEYKIDTPERKLLKNEIARMHEQIQKGGFEVPCIIGGKEIKTGNIFEVKVPHDHKKVLAKVHLAGEKEISLAIEAALQAKKEWEMLAPKKRAEIFIKAADLLSEKWRPVLNAATMLGQSKTVYQAEIDSACELIDFLRMNAHYYEQIQKNELLQPKGIKNHLELRALEGFVFAVTPFNFTAIAGNLPSCPAMLGNVVVWKPSEQQSYAAYITYKIFEEAGLPAGVINLVPARGEVAGKVALVHPSLSGIHFTGSTATFDHIQKEVAKNLEVYKSYPRIVGETGGKDFVIAHSSADPEALITALVRGAYEFQGQKCSAASRAYISKSVWQKIKEPLMAEIKKLKTGGVEDFRNFITAVIDEKAFKKINTYLDYCKRQASVSPTECKILVGGNSDASQGWFVEPTLIQTSNPKFRTMVEEIFGPVLTVYVFDDEDFLKTLKIANETSAYALTGAVIAQDRAVIEQVQVEMLHAAGNFYINDKPTGAVVGQQPFGGSRKSGTNDKAGSYLNLLRWISPRTVKENLNPPKTILYPYMEAE